MVVYAVIERGIIGIYKSRARADKRAEVENAYLDKQYGAGYSDDLWGGKKVFVEEYHLDEGD